MYRIFKHSFLIHLLIVLICNYRAPLYARWHQEHDFRKHDSLTFAVTLTNLHFRCLRDSSKIKELAVRATVA